MEQALLGTKVKDPANPFELTRIVPLYLRPLPGVRRPRPRRPPQPERGGPRCLSSPPSPATPPRRPTPKASRAGGIAVVGVGNLLMGDDGIGIAVIRELARAGLPDGVELVDAGTALLDVLPDLDHCDRVILVDCCRGGGAPGTLYKTRLRPDEWPAGDLHCSTHDLTVLHALQFHRAVGGRLGDLVLVGVEPETVAMQDRLSPALQARLPDVLAAVREEFEAPADPRPGGTR